MSSNPPQIIRVVTTPPIIVTLTQTSIVIRSQSTQGNAGPPGAGGANLLAFEQLTVEDGAQVLTLPYSIDDGTWYLLCINGLRQAVTDYSVTGDLLSLPSGLNVMAGDLISFDFYPVL